VHLENRKLLYVTRELPQFEHFMPFFLARLALSLFLFRFGAPITGV
jgi:hypothetical protein